MSTNEIGMNAGTIWNLLACRESMTIREIAEQVHLKDIIISMALGWLAKEDKIYFFHTNGDLRISLKRVMSDIYY